MGDSKVLLAVGEVCERLSLGRSLVFELLATGAIRSVKIGRRRLVPTGALEEFVKQREREDDGADG